MTHEAQDPIIFALNQKYFGAKALNFKPPFFYDVTLRDGNQALLNPWNTAQKLEVFEMLCALNVQGVEVGYPGASDGDFNSCVEIAKRAPKGMVVGMLARANEHDLTACIRALEHCGHATPRLHTFIGMSPYHMEHALRKSQEEVLKMAVDAVTIAKQALGEAGEVQFSPEHFGDCIANISWVIASLKEIVRSGATIINLPNTVERYRPEVFARFVKRVVDELPKEACIAVHPHNDLDMATATAVASYFSGASQIECTINGLGERAGNVSICNAAIALYNNGVPITLNLEEMYNVALRVAQIAGVPIHEKAALIGSGVFKHRSGIHQNAANRTSVQTKGAYRPITPGLIGRAGDEQCEFTSQSGYSGARRIMQEGGCPVTDNEAKMLMPGLTAAADQWGNLTVDELVAVYESFRALKTRKDTITAEDLSALSFETIQTHRSDDLWKLVGLQYMPVNGSSLGAVELSQNGHPYRKAEFGDGPINALFSAINAIVNVAPNVDAFSIEGITPGSTAQGTARLSISVHGKEYRGTGTDPDIVRAAVKAYLHALNEALKEE